MDVRTRGGVFGAGGRGGGIFDGTSGGFGGLGEVPYEQAAAGIGLGGAVGLGQPPATCPTSDISAESAQKYKTCRANAYSLAVSQCKTYPGPQIECVTPNFYDNFNKADCFRFCVEDCTAAGPIRSVQDELGRPVTGVWTGDDQLALEASGKSFLDLAPGCKGAAPYAAPPAPPPPPPPPPEPEPPPPPPQKGLSTAWIVGGLFAAAAVAGLAYAAQKKKRG